MQPNTEAGDWKCLRILGQGSYGVVALWKNSTNGQLLALKKFEVRTHPPPSERLLADLQDRFRKEVNMMYTINNPYIVSAIPSPKELHEKLAFQANDDYSPPSSVEKTSIPLPLLCMEFCSGGDLRQMLKRPEYLNGLPEKEVLSCLSHISNAISYLHDEYNIAHRDVKPENIVIHYPDSSMSRATYKVTQHDLSDLGFAKDLTSNEGLCSTILGTLPYLAPEIYIGKKYDKTVDYWSFGLIAFEIICGTRPFLPGESPAHWLPLLEKKAKDVIAIYRTEDGRIEQSRDIPYNCHLSPLLRQCLVAWLPSMLQLDPARRGKYVLTKEEVKSGKGDTNALTRLRNMLNTKFLQIQTFPERLVYAIGRSVKMSEVQKWIAQSTNVAVTDQLILTLDGILVQPDELAMKYLELNTDLFLISRNAEQCELKLKFPKELKSFLLTSDSVSTSEAAKIRKVWGSAIYFVQTHLERVYALRKACEALRIYYTKNCTEELKKLINDVDKTYFSLNNLVELEEKLEKLESIYVPEDQSSFFEGMPDSISSCLEEGDKLKAYSKDCFDEWKESVTLKATRITDLEELYCKFLKAYDMWKKAESEGQNFSIEVLVRLICQYKTCWEPFVTTLMDNVRTLLAKIVMDESVKEKLQITVAKLHSLIDEVMNRRVQKQLKILVVSFGEKPSSYESSNSSDGPETAIFINKNMSNKMSQSHTGIIQDVNWSSGDAQQSSKSMSRSLYGSGNRKSSVGKPFSPDFTRLMEETHAIKNELEEDVSNAKSRFKEIIREKSMDWELVQKP